MFVDFATAKKLLSDYGSPLYVYSGDILRARCRELLAAFCGRIKPSFSIKANSNLSLLKIVREEGILADAMSPGEIFLLEKAGFKHSEIFYIGNNVSAEEMQYAIDRDILVSVDSLSQLERFGTISRGGRVAVRFNPGLGAGHCEKVVTGGHHTKFGIQAEFWPQVRELLDKYDLKLSGVNQHIGSLFLEPDSYVQAAENLLGLVLEHFPGLDFIDFGGGFGVPYRPTEQRLDLAKLYSLLKPALDAFTVSYDNKEIHFKCEPGRYIAAECGLLLGTVQSCKDNYGERYIGSDIGFNVLMRPVMYDSYHEITLLAEGSRSGGKAQVVGNICESGDVLGRERELAGALPGDIIAVSNAGAYGYSMATNYNCRLRPAEVLLTDSGAKLIRRADKLEDLLNNF